MVGVASELKISGTFYVSIKSGNMRRASEIMIRDAQYVNSS